MGLLVKETTSVKFGTYKMFVVMENSYKLSSTVVLYLFDAERLHLFSVGTLVIGFCFRDFSVQQISDITEKDISDTFYALDGCEKNYLYRILYALNETKNYSPGAN